MIFKTRNPYIFWICEISHIVQVIVIIIIIILVITFVQGIDNYMPETNHVAGLYSVAAALYLQFMLHVMLFHLWNMFSTFTLALAIVCVQCPILPFFVVPLSPVCCLRNCLEWFWIGSSHPCYYWYHFIVVVIIVVIIIIICCCFKFINFNLDL